MDKKIIIKLANVNSIEDELSSIEFDDAYINEAKLKYNHKTFKLFNLRAVEANILKQLCLSLGFDCAVSRNTIACQCEYTDCIIAATISQYKKLIKKLLIQPFRLKEVAKLIGSSLDNGLKPICTNKIALDWSRPYIMGILNVTPDSFSDGGESYKAETAFEKALILINQGADIIDIGGESTRPGAKTILPEEEIRRIVPVIQKIRKENENIIISVDTRNHQTAQNAIEAGANIINDVTGLVYDKNLSEYVCKNNIPSIIMHSDEVPAITKQSDSPHDIIEEIYNFFSERISTLVQNGLDRTNIILDPGIGFGKSINDNFEIIRRVNEFSSLNCPILMGISRKSFIGKSFNITKDELDEASALYNMIMLNNGINIIRVHDVARHKRLTTYLSKILF